MSAPRPSLTHERRMMRAGAPAVLGIDEVGRGSLAGPLTVGVVLVLPTTPSAPTGIRDSKQLTAAAREQLAPKIRRWAAAWAVAHVWPEEIDQLGMTASLRVGALRAIEQLDAVGAHVLLDGSHDYLADRCVVTRIKADGDCSSVAAASILAKVERDGLMRQMAADEDRYDWCNNKGYSAPEHLAALALHGPSLLHRLSWQLPRVDLAALEVVDPARTRSWRRFAEGEQLVLDGPRVSAELSTAQNG